MPASERAPIGSSPARDGPQPLSLRRNIVWTFLGNVGHAGCQVGLLLVLAKLGTPKMVGQFVLGIAVATPIFMFTNLGLRSVQATDSRREFQFGDYLGMRLLASFVALFSVVGIGAVVGCRREALGVVMLVGLAKGIASISDIFYGLFQQQERLDWIAKSKFSQGVLSLCGLSAGVSLTGSVVVGAYGFLFSWLIVLLVYDLPCGLCILRPSSSGAGLFDRLTVLRPRWNVAQWRGLARLGVPIGGTALLSSLNKHIPRYFIVWKLGMAQLGIFGALATLMMAGTTISRALNQASCPRLAKYHAAGNTREFRRLFTKLLLFYVVSGIAGVVLVWVAGRPLLSLLFQPQYAQHADVLVYVMIAAGVTYVAALLDTAMIAVRLIRPLLPLMGLTIVTVLGACYLLVPEYGLAGAGMSLAISKIPLVVVGLVLLRRFTRRRETSGFRQQVVGLDTTTAVYE